MTTTVLGILFVTALAAIDWYVWSAAGSASFRRPISARPLTLRELSNKFLGRLVATNAGVLPASALVNNEAKADQHDHGHGFKKVA
jgi:hypothetical protein